MHLFRSVVKIDTYFWYKLTSEKACDGCRGVYLHPFTGWSADTTMTFPVFRLEYSGNLVAVCCTVFLFHPAISKLHEIPGQILMDGRKINV